MRLKTIFSAFSVLAVLCSALSSAADVDYPGLNRPIPLVEYDLLVVQVPEAAAIPLIPRLRDKKQSAQATATILEMIGAKKATLIGWPILTTKSGQRAVVEQIEEFRYASEYKSPEKIKATEKPANPSDHLDPVPGGDTTKQSAEAANVRTVFKETDAIPASFETRNVGVTLEIEGVVHPDGRTVDISLVPQHVTLLEMQRVEIEDQKSGKKMVVEQPYFRTNKLTTSIDVQDGDYTLLGTFKIEKPQGFIELFILHTQIKK